jgi:hypothetical protein
MQDSTAAPAWPPEKILQPGARAGDIKDGMFALGVLLIAGGLACLAFLFVSLARRPVPDGTAPPVDSSAAAATATAQTSPGGAPGLSAPTRAGPAATASPANPVQAPAGDARLRAPNLMSGNLRLRAIDSEGLAESLRLLTRQETTPAAREESLVVRGVLYLDRGRRLERMIGHAPESLERLFSELTRIGPATLSADGGGFLIHSGNASYSYSASDLDQIIFQSGGVALAPAQSDRPCALFLCEESERIKDYIKKRARVRAL